MGEQGNATTAARPHGSAEGMLAWLFLPFVLTVQAAALHTHLRGDTIGAWGAAYVVGGLVVAVLFWRTGIRRTSRPLGWATLVALLGSVVLIQRDEVWAYAGVAVCLLCAGAFWLSPRGARLTGTRTDEVTIGGRGATPSGGAPGTGDDARPEGTGPPDADAERQPAVARTRASPSATPPGVDRPRNRSASSWSPRRPAAS